MWLTTDRPRLFLRSLGPDDAADCVALVRANAEHLTKHGDYTDLVGTPVAEFAATLAAGDPRRRFGIVEDGRLVGTVELVLGEPPKYGLGYLLAEHACGRVLATSAVRAVAGHARGTLAATDILAGVAHGNHASAAVLERVGFTRAARFDTYDRYHRDLVPASPHGADR